MNRQKLFVVIQILVLSGIIAMVAGCTDLSDDRKEMLINSSRAVEIVKNDTISAKYISENFKMPDWRVERAVLINESQYNKTGLNGEEELIWKVEILERTCSCSSIKDLYVIEGYVSPYSGEILNITTDQVMETQYDKETCASTVCH